MPSDNTKRLNDADKAEADAIVAAEIKRAALYDLRLCLGHARDNYTGAARGLNVALHGRDAGAIEEAADETRRALFELSTLANRIAAIEAANA